MATKKLVKRKIKKTIRRKYKGSDSYMLEQSQTLHDLFDLDKADFIAKVTDLDNPFAANWQTAITAAINYTDDSVILGQIAPQTFTVTEAMQAARDKYTEIIFYAERAFGKTSPVLKEFGKGNAYLKAGKSQEKMFQFMDELSATANKYKTQLIAKGTTQPAIDEIANLRDALNTGNRAQNLAIKGRPVISEGRTKAYNTASDFMRLVLDAAPLVYKDQPAKLGQYVFNPPVNHKKAIRKGNLETLAIAYIDLEDIDAAPTDPVVLQATDTDMTFYSSSKPGISPEPDSPKIEVHKNHLYTTTAEEIASILKFDDTTKYINVQNTGTGKGEYKFTIG